VRPVSCLLLAPGSFLDGRDAGRRGEALPRERISGWRNAGHASDGYELLAENRGVILRITSGE